RDRGMAAFVFDYRNFGASGGAPRQLVDPTLQVADWNAAIAFVKDLPGIDPARIAVYGSSMGAGHALITAAKRDDVQAVVAQVPLIDTRVEGEATFFGVGWVTRLLATAWGDLWLAAFGAEPVTIPAIAPSGGFGMLVDDRAYAAFETLVRPGLTYRNAVVARSIFTFDDYNPAIQAAGLTKPVLLIASRADRFAPFSAVETFAKAGPNRAVHEVNCDHFEIYVPPCSTDAHAAAVQFLHGVFAARSG
ncbi:MAG TPA: hypothetical protein DCL54_06035, partial [Alphaproteobacteria bacterium]|nr:hypothetical protein [Alphaproteobacteria bacterium]